MCDFIVFPRNKSKKIVGLPKFAETRKYFSPSQTTHVSARCISARRITRLAKMEKERRPSWKKDAVRSIFQWSSKKRSRTTLGSKGKRKGEYRKNQGGNVGEKSVSNVKGSVVSSRNYKLIFRKKTGQLKELGDKVQQYQNENQKREHASALKEDKLDVHVCFSSENFRSQDKYIRFYTGIISWDEFLHLLLAM